MARYRGPKLKKVRRLGPLPQFTQKFSIKKHAPGEHGITNAGKKTSEYCDRLKEKQKLQLNYGISDKQLFAYLCKAKKLAGSTDQNLINLLEMRLDNIVYRLGFASTLPFARQLVNHGHIMVNDQNITIPSYQCKKDFIISIRDNKKSKNIIHQNINFNKKLKLPTHLSFDAASYIGKIENLIDRKEIELQFNELLVIEYYSKNF